MSSLRPWPSCSDFATVLQKPALAFRDPRLKKARIATDRHGLPQVRGGTSANVYQAIHPDGGSECIRVFTSLSSGRGERYQRIQEHLEGRRPDSLVNFEYQDQGIRSAGDGRLYPLVVMEWVSGETLWQWVSAKCLEKDRRALARASDRWIETVDGLGKARIAHGDLNDTNILVESNGKLKLVDYDTMCVPALVGCRNPEIGTDPYRHPDRNTETLLSLDLDNFSALLILVALRALAAAPNLWKTWVEKPRYERLLFRREDFDAAQQSDLIWAVEHSPDRCVQRLCRVLIEAARVKIDEVPRLDQVEFSVAEVLLDQRDFDGAVRLLQRSKRRMSDAPTRLKPQIHDALRRARCLVALQDAVWGGDVVSMQRLHVSKLLDDYPKAEPLVTIVRQRLAELDRLRPPLGGLDTWGRRPLVSWPRPLDFAMMLQNPGLAFRDSRLRRIEITQDTCGLPRVWATALTNVYRGKCPDGRFRAIFVFTTPSTERREHLRCITEHLKNHRPDSLVSCEYQEEGIRSAGDGRFYPLVVTDWVFGQTLWQWVRAKCRENDSQALAQVSDLWIETINELRAADIAHGDLSHDSVFVTENGTLKLAGYSTMCVPALVGRKNLEVGTFPYQHPDRNANTLLTLNLDNFPALLILVAFKGLAADPKLWHRHVEQTASEKLLFRLEDLYAPHQSKLIRELTSSPDSDVRWLCQELVASTRVPIDEVPTLHELLNRRTRLAQREEHPTQLAETYHVFISAKSTDYSYAQKVYTFLVSHGVPTFFCQESLPELASSDFREEIERALDQIQHMIVVTSSAENVGDDWVKWEWGSFINEKLSKRKYGNLITLVGGNVTPKDLPFGLRQAQVIPYESDSFERLLQYVRR